MNTAFRYHNCLYRRLDLGEMLDPRANEGPAISLEPLFCLSDSHISSDPHIPGCLSFYLYQVMNLISQADQGHVTPITWQKHQHQNILTVARRTRKPSYLD